MTIVSTHYRGTPARPLAQEIRCLRGSHGHVHLASTDVDTTLELTVSNGATASLLMSTPDLQQLSACIREVLHDRDAEWGPVDTEVPQISTGAEEPVA